MNSEDALKYESESIVIKVSEPENNQKEYFLSIGNKKSNVEIYDFENNKIIIQDLESFIGNKYSECFRNAAIFIPHDNSYLFALNRGTSENSNDFKFYFMKHKFKSLNDFKNRNTFKNYMLLFIIK